MRILLAPFLAVVASCSTLDRIADVPLPVATSSTIAAQLTEAFAAAAVAADANRDGVVRGASEWGAFLTTFAVRVKAIVEAQRTLES